MTVFVKHLLAFSTAFLLTIVVVSCSEEKEYKFPVVLTGEVVNIDSSGALLSGLISLRGADPILYSGFYCDTCSIIVISEFFYTYIWGQGRVGPVSEEPNGIRLENEQTPEEVFFLKTNFDLQQEETYFVRAFVETHEVRIFGEEVTFTYVQE